MNRRSFLAVLGTAPIAVPIVARAALTAPPVILGADVRAAGVVVVSPVDIVTAFGRDLAETLDQLAFEHAELARRGLSRQSLSAASATSSGEAL